MRVWNDRSCAGPCGQLDSFASHDADEVLTTDDLLQQVGRGRERHSVLGQPLDKQLCGQLDGRLGGSVDREQAREGIRLLLLLQVVGDRGIRVSHFAQGGFEVRPAEIHASMNQEC